MPEANYTLLPVETQLLALQNNIEQVTTALIKHDEVNKPMMSTVYQTLLSVLNKATTQAAYNNSEDERLKQRGCKSDASRKLGISRRTLFTRIEDYEIQLTPVDEDIPA